MKTIHLHLVFALMACSWGSLGCGAAADAAPEEEHGEQDLELNGEPDWAMVGRTARRTSNNPLESVIGTSNVASLVETWSAGEQGSYGPSLTLWNSRLFVSNLEYPDSEWGVAYKLEAFEPDTGARLWQAPLPEDQSGTFNPEPFTSAMAVAYGRVHIQHTNFSPVLSARTGQLLDRGALKTGMDDRVSAPLLKGDTLVVETWGEYYSELGDYRRTVFATDTRTNTRLWRKPLGVAFKIRETPLWGRASSSASTVTRTRSWH